MQHRMLRSKILRATVIHAKLMYKGSLTPNTVLMEAGNMLPFEQVQVLNVNNGERLKPYLITGIKGPGEECLY